jgi:hypothetical protein
MKSEELTAYISRDAHNEKSVRPLYLTGAGISGKIWQTVTHTKTTGVRRC